MLEVIEKRRSVRKFDLSKKISYDELVELCRYASCAPTARNQDDKEYVIVDDEFIIDKLSMVAKGTMILKDCNTVIAIIGKPISLALTPAMVPQDLAAATQNILLASTAKGFGSCWCGIYPIEDRMLKAKEALGIKDDRFVFSLIALGYPLDKDALHKKDKFNLNDVFHNQA